jgi:hypothetical protein
MTRPADGPDDPEFDDTVVVTVRTVRPYTLTGGRTRTSGLHIALESIIGANGAGEVPGSAERRAIVALARDQVLSLAEISAHLKLPLGVTRVLIGDLAAEGLLTIDGAVTARADDVYPAHDASLLETVLDALSAL